MFELKRFLVFYWPFILLISIWAGVDFFYSNVSEKCKAVETRLAGCESRANPYPGKNDNSESGSGNKKINQAIDESISLDASTLNEIREMLRKPNEPPEGYVPSEYELARHDTEVNQRGMMYAACASAALLFWTILLLRRNAALLTDANRHMESAAEAANNTLEQAQEATNITRETLRETERFNSIQLKPYLSFVDLEYKWSSNAFPDQRSIQVFVRIKNVGKSPALNISQMTKTNLVGFIEDESTEPVSFQGIETNYSGFQLPSLAPGDEFNMHMIFSLGEIEGIGDILPDSAIVKLVFSGSFNFTDGFGGELRPCQIVGAIGEGTITQLGGIGFLGRDDKANGQIIES